MWSAFLRGWNRFQPLIDQSDESLGTLYLFTFWFTEFMANALPIKHNRHKSKILFINDRCLYVVVWNSSYSGRLYVVCFLLGFLACVFGCCLRCFFSWAHCFSHFFCPLNAQGSTIRMPTLNWDTGVCATVCAILTTKIEKQAINLIAFLNTVTSF